MLDLFKYYDHFSDQGLKFKLEEQLITKQNEKLNESEEEELKLMNE